MRFIFRADASKAIGSGHVMRLSAIAEEAVFRGIECCFYGSLGNLQWLVDRLAMLGVCFIDSNMVPKFDIRFRDVLILDSYQISQDDPLVNSDKWLRKVLIADKTTPDYKSDLVFYIGEGARRQKFSEIIFEGYDYMPIRRFIKPAEKIPTSPSTKSIVVCGGGTDPFGFSRSIAEVISGRAGFEKAVFFSEDDTTIGILDSRFEVKTFGRELDIQIQKSSLVFTTASTLAFEVLSLNIPIGIGCATDNQRDFLDYFLKHGLASEIATRQNSRWDMKIDKIDSLIASQSTIGQTTLSGNGGLKLNGAARIVDLVESSI